MQKYSAETDEQLVRLYEEGNDAAFDQLLARHQQKVYSYIFGLVHDEDRANDIFQEVFIRAIMRIRSHQYVESGRFQQWLIRIAHNIIIDMYRREQLLVLVGDDVEVANIKNVARMTDSAPDERINIEESYSDIEKMIQLLPEPQQQVVKMRIYDNLPFKDIAQLTGCSINTALGRMRYAVLNLRRMAVKRDLTALAL